MVYRVYVEKKPGISPEADSLLANCKSFLGIKNLESIRILNRYDADNIEKSLFDYAINTVFSEPQLDDVSESFVSDGAKAVIAVEPLPGQFDQRADSAAQCIQLISQGERPTIASAKVYILYGELTAEDIDSFKKYVINPVESREASLEMPENLSQKYEQPSSVATVEGFISMDDNSLAELADKMGLAMDLDDLKFLQDYFKNEEKHDPTVTEIRVVDTYWSDHCRHTTFSTIVDKVSIDDPEVEAAYERYLKAREEVYGVEKASKRPQTLMDLATIGAKVLKKRELLPEIDISEEINACSIHVPAVVDGKEEDWLLMFKNETHNHPTEIEPFGGAATCIGGCIRDPLSGRAYVHQAMRVTGGGDPRKEIKDTLAGKLPQRKLAQTAAAGYSSYGNQIGLATGHVAEMYNEGYIAKRLECGAVVAAAPARNVVRECPAPGDVIILLGGRTGRDGIGGATGSSKSHNTKSLLTMASEVQKGNAPEERKIQRLFRNGEVTRLIKRCNDFGAGGVSVAIGELADGLEIELDNVRRKYDGLDGTELAISESQERMAVVVAAEDEEKFIAEAQKENLEAYRVAVVTESPRLVMNWKGQTVANLSRAFLNTNGASKHTEVSVPKMNTYNDNTASNLKDMASSLKSASQRGLVERFDSTIGAGSILMPYGGKTQTSPTQAMAALLPVLPGEHTEQASIMSWGCDPEQLSVNPYNGAKSSVYTSVAKIVAAGADYKKAYLSLQEFFEKLQHDSTRWGKPFSALLGALDAQLEIGAAAIGGKDSMSGSFMNYDVPPTVISFAIAPALASDVISTDFKSADNKVYLFGSEGSVIDSWSKLYDLMQSGKVLSAFAVENGIAEAIMKMSFGNEIGFKSSNDGINWYKPMPGAIIAELNCDTDCAVEIGTTTANKEIAIANETVAISELRSLNDAVLEKVYPTDVEFDKTEQKPISYEGVNTKAPALKIAKAKAVIPVFPGTNCEYDTQRALVEAGNDAEIFVIRNLTSDDVSRSVEQFASLVKSSQMIVIPGGFSGGDEPDGSAKFITAFFRNPAVKEQVMSLLNDRDGLMLGICNGFQALIKLGLLSTGTICDTDSSFPTLTYNMIGRHQSRIVRTRIASNKSPWLAATNVGDVFAVPISHGEGRFIASDDVLKSLISNGQVATQYVNLDNNPSMDLLYNPNGSVCAIEGITSPDGRILGKMGHSERIGKDTYKNVPDNYDMKLFASAAAYFNK